jgi:hypothetical protein
MKIHLAFNERNIKRIVALFIVVSIVLLCYLHKYYKNQSDSYFKSLTRLKLTKFYIGLYLNNSSEAEVQKFYANLKKLENKTKVIDIDIDIDLVYFSSILISINEKIELKYVPMVEDVFLDGFGEKILLVNPDNNKIYVNKKAFFEDLDLFIWSKGKDKVNNFGFGDDIIMN